MSSVEAMTARERIEAALDGRPVDRLPWSPCLAYVWENFPEHIQKMGQPEFLRQVGADPLWRGTPCPVRTMAPDGLQVETKSENGRSVTMFTTPVGRLRQAYCGSEDGRTSFLVEHPLKSREDFKVQMWIEENTRYKYNDSPVRAHYDGDGRDGLSLGLLLPRSKTAYQSLVEHHVGTEELVYALADFPETVESLWEVMVSKNLEAVELAARCDLYAYWLSFEDSSTQNYSPAQYDRYIGSEIARWCKTLDAVGGRLLQHACGHVKELVPRMKKHGVYGVESISPPPTGNMTIAEARRSAGSDFAIIGGIEPTRFLNLSISELDGYVEQVIAEGAGGPFVLANSDSCPPGVGMEKFRLVGDVVRRGMGAAGRSCRARAGQAARAHAISDDPGPLDIVRATLETALWWLPPAEELGFWLAPAETAEGAARWLASMAGRQKELPRACRCAVKELASTPESPKAARLCELLKRIKETGLADVAYANMLARSLKELPDDPSWPIVVRKFKTSRLQPPVADIAAARPPRPGLALRPVPFMPEHELADIRKVHGGADGVVYIEASVKVARAYGGALAYGADGPVKVWVNGRAVDCRPKATNPARIGQYVTPVTWKKGVNRISFALATNRGKAWGVQARVLRSRGISTL